MVLHRPSDQWRGVVGALGAADGWGCWVNAFLIAGLVLLLIQIGIVGLIFFVGDRMSYHVHQAICSVGMALWFPITTLSLIGAAVGVVGAIQ